MSSANPNAAALGEFDLLTLKRMRVMAERHVRTAIGSITAASSAADAIQDFFLDEFSEMAYATWAEGTGVVRALFGDLPNPLFQSRIDTAVVESVSFYRQLLNTVLDKQAFGREPIYGEFFKGSIVQPGDVRPLLVRLGGGSTDSNVPLLGGVGSGLTMREWLRSNGIDTNLKIWLYGIDEKRRNLNGHMQLDGLTFESWDDDGLRIAPQDAWLRRTHYSIGDHFGCFCIAAPFVPNMGEPFEITLPR